MADKPVTSGKICNWILQILIWFSLVGMIIGIILSHGYYVFPLIYIQFILIYIFYFVVSLCSNNYSYLRNITTGNTIYGYMGQLFYTPAFVDFHISCYHMVTRTHRTKHGTRTSRHRVTTYTETITFKYMSWRDVSGPFHLNTSGFARDPKVAMVKLHLKFDLEFANDGTAFDFECQRNYFINRNKNRDAHYEFSQSNRMQGYKEFNLINMDGKPHSSISAFWHVFFTFIMLVEFYKMYVESYCIRQEYKVIKLVSTKNNLNLQTVFLPYIERIPSVRVLDQSVTYNDPGKFGEVQIVPNLPEMSEIEKEHMKNFTPGRGPGPEIQENPNFLPPDDGRDKAEGAGDNFGPNVYGAQQQGIASQQPYGAQPQQSSGAQPQQPYGAQPQQPYGAQPQQPYGAQPQQPYGAQPQQPYSVNQNPMAGNPQQQNMPPNQPQNIPQNRPQNQPQNMPQNQPQNRPPNMLPNQNFQVNTNLNVNTGNSQQTLDSSAGVSVSLNTSTDSNTKLNP